MGPLLGYEKPRATSRQRPLGTRSGVHNKLLPPRLRRGAFPTSAAPTPVWGACLRSRLRLADVDDEGYLCRMNERLTIELPDTIVARLREIAAQNGLTVEQFIASCAAAQATPDGVRPAVAALFDAVLDEYSELYHRLA